jgi:CHAD domain-containing protein
VGAALALVDPALRGDTEGVHDFRVAARSLRAALRTLTRRPHGSAVRKTRRTLRIAIRALATVRDRDVSRSLLAKLPAAEPRGEAFRRRTLALSDHDRRVALVLARRRWPKDLDRRLVDLLLQKEATVKTIILRSRAEAWQRRRQSIDIVEALGRRYVPRRLHELRIRVRRLRYAIEILAEVDSAAQARVLQLKPLQSALGDAQDLIVLSQWLARQATRLRRSDSALSKALRSEAGRFRAQSIQAHDAFLRLRPKDLLERLALHVDSSRGFAPSATSLGPHRPPAGAGARSPRNGRRTRRQAPAPKVH